MPWYPLISTKSGTPNLASLVYSLDATILSFNSKVKRRARYLSYVRSLEWGSRRLRYHGFFGNRYISRSLFSRASDRSAFETTRFSDNQPLVGW
jgi:hypothetical protein